MTRSLKGVIVAIVTIIVIGTCYSEAAVNDLLPQTNIPTLSVTGVGGLVSDSWGNYYYCQGSDIYKTITLTGVSSKWYTNAAGLDSCRGLAIESTGTYLFATGSTNVYRFSLADGSVAKVGMNNATINAFDATSTGLVANLNGLTIDGVNTLFVFNNRAEGSNRHAWSYSLGSSSTPGVWSIVVDGRTDLGIAEAIALDYVPGATAQTLLFTQGASTTVDGSQIGVIYLDGITTAQTDFSGIISGIFPLSTAIYGLVHQSTSNSVSVYYVSIGQTNVWESISIDSSYLSDSMSNNGVVTFPNSGTFVGPVYASTYDQFYGSILFIAGTTVQRIIDQAFTFYPSTHYPLNGDGPETFAMAFTPATLQQFKFNLTLINPPLKGLNGQVTSTVEAGSNQLLYTYQPPTPADVSNANFYGSFAIDGTSPSQWISHPGNVNFRELITQYTYGPLRQLVDRPTSLADYHALHGATQIAVDSTLQAVYVANGRVINVVSTATGVISSLCTAGTNTVLVGLVTDDTYIYAVDSSNVYRCPLIGGTLTLYSVGGVALATPVRGIAIAKQNTPITLFVTAGTNVQLLTIDGGISAAVSAPIVGGTIPFDFPNLIVAQPDGQQFWVSGQFPGTTNRPLFQCSPTLPIQGDFSLLGGSVACASYLSTSEDVQSLTLRWDKNKAILYRSQGSSQITGCYINQNNCPFSYDLSSYVAYVNPISMVYRGGGSFFLLTLDTSSNAAIIAPRIERLSSRNEMASFLFRPLFPLGFGYTNQTNIIRAQLQSSQGADLALEGPTTISVICKDSNNVIVNDPNQRVTAWTTFDFQYYPIQSSVVRCAFQSFQSRDLVRISRLELYFQSYRYLEIVDHAFEMTINWPTQSRPLYVGTQFFLWTGGLERFEAGVDLSVDCTGGLKVTADPHSLFNYDGVFQVTSDLIGVNITCTATITGPQTSLIRISNPASDNIPVVAQRIISGPSGTIASPIVVSSGSGHHMTLTRPPNNTQLESIAVGYQCGYSNDRARVQLQAVFDPVGPDQADIVWWFDEPGLARCTSSINYGNNQDSGMYQLLPDIYFHIISPPVIRVNGLPQFNELGSNVTSTDYTLTVANPLNAAGQSFTLSLTCNNLGSSYDYSASVTVTTGVIGTDSTITLDSSTNTFTFTNVSTQSSTAANFTVTVSTVPDYHPASIQCQFHVNGVINLPSSINFDESLTPYGNGVFIFGVGRVDVLPTVVVSRTNVYLNSVNRDSVQLTWTIPSSMYNYMNLYYYCYQGSNVEYGFSASLSKYSGSPFTTSYFQPDSRVYQPGSVTCSPNSRYSIGQPDFVHYIYPSFNFTLLAPTQLIATGQPITGQLGLNGSLTDNTYFTINLGAPNNVPSGETLTAQLYCNVGTVTPSGGNSNDGTSVLFNSTGSGNATYVISVPPLASMSDSYGIHCDWNIGGSVAHGYIQPAGFNFWMGPKQEQLVVSFDTAAVYTSTIVVGRSSYVVISTQSGSGNIFSDITLQMNCDPSCGSTNTGSLGGFSQQITGNFPNANNVGPVSVRANTVGTAVCTFTISGTDAPHFIVPPPLTFNVVTLKTLSATITGGPISPIVAPATGSVLYTPAAITPQPGANSIFTVTVAAPLVNLAYQLICTQGNVTVSGGSSASGTTVTWLNTTTATGVYTITIPNNAVKGVTEYCYWSASFVGPQWYTDVPFSFYIGPTVQLVASFIDRPYGSGDNVVIGLTTSTGANTTIGFNINVLCTTTGGGSISGSPVASFYPNTIAISSVTITGNTVTPAVCTFIQLPSTNSEWGRFLLPQPITIRFGPATDWSVTAGGKVINQETSSTPINLVAGTLTVPVTIAPAASLYGNDIVTFRLNCEFDINIGLEVTPSPYVKFSSGASGQQTLQVHLLPSNTIVSPLSATITCVWDHLIQPEFGKRYAVPSSFTLTIGDPITFTITPALELNSNSGGIYANPVGTYNPEIIVYRMTPSRCSTQDGRVSFNADCGYNGARGTISFDGGDYFSCYNDITFRFRPTQYAGALTCIIGIQSQRTDSYHASMPITFNILPRSATWSITNLPAQLPLGQTTSFYVAPSVTPGPGGVEAEIIYNNGYVSITPQYLFFPSGSVTPQAVNLTITSSTYVDEHTGGWIQVIGSDYDDAYKFIDTYQTFTAGVALSQSTTYQVASLNNSVCGGVMVTLTLANPPNYVTANLNCYSSWNTYSRIGSVDYLNNHGELEFTHNGVLTQTVRLYNTPINNGNLTCYWSFRNTDQGLYNNYDRFNIQYGTQENFILSPSIPIAMLPNTTFTFTIVPSININTYLRMDASINPSTSASIIDTTYFQWNAGIPQPITVNLYASPFADKFELSWQPYDTDAAGLATPPPVTVTVATPSSLTVTPPAAIVTYSGASFSIGITPTASVALDFTVHATCTGDVTLVSGSLSFTTGATSSQSFTLTPTILTVNTDHVISCSFTIDGPGALFINSLSTVSFTYHIPATVVPTASSSSSSTGSPTGSTGPSVISSSSTGSIGCVDCSSDQISVTLNISGMVMIMLSGLIGRYLTQV